MNIFKCFLPDATQIKLSIAKMSRVRRVVLSAEEELMFNDKVSKMLVQLLSNYAMVIKLRS